MPTLMYSKLSNDFAVQWSEYKQVIFFLSNVTTIKNKYELKRP